MKWCYLHLLLCLLLLAGPAMAQKNAPVIGDAASLIDLLKKDYNSQALEEQKELLLKDRATVIGIFKSYLSPNNQLKLDPLLKNNTASDSITAAATDSFLKDKELNNITINLKEIKADALASIKQNLDKRDDAQKDYYNARFTQDNNTLRAIASVFATDSNQYLSDIILLFRDKYNALNKGGTDPYSSVNHTAMLQKSIPFLGGDMVFETMIDGLGKFMANRIKEELTIYVIREMQGWLEPQKENQNGKKDNGKLRENTRMALRIFLPRTTGYITGFTAEKVTGFPSEIRQYIEDDLNHIMDHMAAIREIPGVDTLFNQHPDLDFALEALQIIPDMTLIKNPIDYFKVIESSRNINRWKTDINPVKKNIGNALQLSSLLAHSMQVMENGEARLASTDFIWNYIESPEFFKLYTGFLYQQNSKYYEIEFSGRSLFAAQLGKVVNSNNADSVKNYRTIFENLIMDISRDAEKVYATSLDIRRAKKGGAKIGADTIYNFVGSLIDFSESVFLSSNELLQQLKVIRGDTLKRLIQPYFFTAKKSNAIFLDLQQKRYASSIIKTFETMDTLIRLYDKTKTIFDDHLNNKQRVMTLIHFVNDMATAKDAADVEKAIEALALPSGSFTIKREALFNVAINAYPGILMAWERSWDKGKTTDAFSPSFTVPIGIGVSKSGRSGSWGLFLSIIDIAAVTRLHLDSDTATQTLPEFSFKSILAPGLFLTYGIPRVPISINIGCQYGPGLREIVSDDVTKTWESLRTGIGIVVDLPLLNLHNKPRLSWKD